MSYLFLTLGIVCELASLTALKETDGFTRPLPVALFVAGLGVSFYFEALALRTLPIGLTYAVWAGVGIVGMAVIGATFYGETINAGIIVGLALILAGVVVLNYWTPGQEAAAPVQSAAGGSGFTPFKGTS